MSEQLHRGNYTGLRFLILIENGKAGYFTIPESAQANINMSGGNKKITYTLNDKVIELIPVQKEIAKLYCLRVEEVIAAAILVAKDIPVHTINLMYKRGDTVIRQNIKV